MKPILPESPYVFTAIQAALKAGHMLKKGFGTSFAVSTKTNPQDLVTEFDRAAEKIIIDFIREKHPTHAFLAEESGSIPMKDAPVRWIIDPLDGTTNFAHHIPLFVVSIAAQVGDDIEVGVIYQPMTDELFVAQRGQGAYLNGTRMRVSQITEIPQSVICAGYVTADARRLGSGSKQFIDLMNIGNPLRLMGSAAMAMAYVAAGRFDVFWGVNLQPWDLAAGKLLLEEAGGSITHFDGSLFELFGQANILATNKHLHGAILEFLK